MTRPICRHCADPRRTVNRPLGLCWSCYFTPGVRDLYPSTSKYGRAGVGARVNPNQPAAAPTDAPPGSAEKIAVIEERARLGQSLWHPEDSRK